MRNLRTRWFAASGFFLLGSMAAGGQNPGLDESRANDVGANATRNFCESVALLGCDWQLVAWQVVR
jgi:hypothetical protein